MLKKQLEQGKLAPTGPAGGVAVPGVVPGLLMTSMGQVMEGQVQYHQTVPGAQEMQQQVRWIESFVFKVSFRSLTSSLPSTDSS